ncbi:MAG: twin-arginine translocase subunit TatC [Bacteroidales bacterium]|nr:twin-arginine translocase subunit TatC [Bacteroidales bacterium]
MDDKEMTFWDHLEVLRWSILRTGIAIAAAFCVCFAFMPKLFDAVILSPTKNDFFMYKALGGLFDGNFNVDIININVTAPFFTHMSTSLWVSLILVFPYILWEVWRFVAPALYPSEKKGVKAAFTGVGGLFYLGCALGYFIIFPITFRFLAGYHIGTGILTQISLNSYISTFLSIIFVMGLVFELPVLAFLLSSLGVLHKPCLKKYRRYAIVILLIVAALITPTGDPFTLMVVTIPLYLLYEVSILIVKP